MRALIVEVDKNKPDEIKFVFGEWSQQTISIPLSNQNQETLYHYLEKKEIIELIKYLVEHL